MNFLTPLAFLGLLLAIPVILLYMLRLRRREMPISSTFLWRQILQDTEANTPWQRLRRNLLLLLQLIILALLVFGLARPFITVPAVSAGQIAVLLDGSASMNATDSPAGTRFEEARQRALEIVETMSDGDTMTVILAADTPEVLTPYTADRTQLQTAIRAAQPSRATANWNAALTLAAAGSIGSSDFSAVIISDGNVGEAARLPAIPGDLRYVPVGNSNQNLAITALATRALPGETPQLFAQVTNYGAQDADVIFSLRVDGELFTAERYTIPAGEEFPLVSSALPEGFESVEATLTRPADSTTPDYLLTDDAAYTVATSSEARRTLLMTDGNLFLEQVLRSLPASQAFQGDTEIGLPGGEFDLYVFDGWLPTELPTSGDLLIIDPPRSTPLFTVGGVTDATDDVRVRSEDPRMAFVDFDNVNVLEFTQTTADWAEPLITAEGGALLLAGETDGRQIAILTFDLRDSDLPLQIAFPVLMSSLLDWFTPGSMINVPDGLRVGESLGLRALPEADTARVTLPDGTTRDIALGEAAVFAETEQPGLYQLDALQNGNVVQSASFAVNLFDVGESNIAPQTSLTLGDTVVSQAVEEEIGQREFWPLLAALALVVLLIEWYAYQRRQRAPVKFAPLVRRSAR
jgi:Ca-activated chloride channel homolog